MSDYATEALKTRTLRYSFEIQQEFSCSSATADYLATVQVTAEAISEPSEPNVATLAYLGFPMAPEFVPDTRESYEQDSDSSIAVLEPEPIYYCQKCSTPCPQDQVKCCMSCLKKRIAELTPKTVATAPTAPRVAPWTVKPSNPINLTPQTPAAKPKRLQNGDIPF